MSSTSSAPADSAAAQAATEAHAPATTPVDTTAVSAAPAPVTAAEPASEVADVSPETSTDTDPDSATPSDTTEASGDAPVATKSETSPAVTGARLAELFPGLFQGPAKPFKLRIQVDIQERAPGEFSKQALSAFFRRHTGTTSYLMAVSQGTERFDLDGQVAGELTEEHRQVATEELARRRAITKARREEAIQAQREAHREAQREVRKQEQNAQQQNHVAHQERRNRAQLLRDFEGTRLTAANFCALKGIAPDALDGLLAQAREEAKQDALSPRPQARRDQRDAAPRDGRGPRREGGREGGARPDNRPPRKTS